MPCFDMLLVFVCDLLNQFSVEQICTKVLELTSVEDRRLNGTLATHFENRILHEALVKRTAQSGTIRKVGKMCSEAIHVLNTLL